MADNISMTDRAGTEVVVAAKDLSSVFYPKHITTDDAGNITPAADAAARARHVIVGNGTITLGVFAEDSAHSSGDKGLMMLAVREATATDLSAGNTDGDYEPLQVDASGRLWVNAGAVTPGVAAANLGKAEDAAHSSGDTGVMMLAVREATATDLSAGSTDGDYEPLQVDASGRLWVNAGVVTPGTAASNLGKAEDAAHTTGDVGVMMLAVREATATDLSAGNTDGDYEPLQVDASGRLWVNAGVITPGTAATNLGKAEDAAHTTGDVGVMVLAVRADTAASTSGTAGDYSALTTDSTGRLWSRSQDDGPGWTSVFGVSGACFTSNDASAAAVAVTDAPTTGQKVVVTDLTVSCGAALTVTFTEETSGTVILKLYVAANSSQTVSFRSKVKLATANKKLMVQTSGAGAVAVLASYYSEA